VCRINGLPHLKRLTSTPPAAPIAASSASVPSGLMNDWYLRLSHASLAEERLDQHHWASSAWSLFRVPTRASTQDSQPRPSYSTYYRMSIALWPRKSLLCAKLAVIFPCSASMVNESIGAMLRDSLLQTTILAIRGVFNRFQSSRTINQRLKGSPGALIASAALFAWAHPEISCPLI
jgi:hypothetical protein